MKTGPEPHAVAGFAGPTRWPYFLPWIFFRLPSFYPTTEGYSFFKIPLDFLCHFSSLGPSKVFFKMHNPFKNSPSFLSHFHPFPSFSSIYRILLLIPLFRFLLLNLLTSIWIIKTSALIYGAVCETVLAAEDINALVGNFICSHYRYPIVLHIPIDLYLHIICI